MVRSCNGGILVVMVEDLQKKKRINGRTFCMVSLDPELQKEMVITPLSYLSQQQDMGIISITNCQGLLSTCF